MIQSNRTYLKIVNPIEQIDWNQYELIYVQLISKESLTLFKHFCSQGWMNSQIGKDLSNLDEFLSSWKMSCETFESCIDELMSSGLIKYSYERLIDNSISLGIRINKPNGIADMFKNKKLRKEFQSRSCPEIFSQIKELINIHYGEIDDEDIETKKVKKTSGSNKTDKKSKKNKEEKIIDDETYGKFYSGVMGKCNCTFKLSNEILRLIQKHYLIEKTISIEKLIEFGFDSLIKTDKEIKISDTNFEFLIDQEVNEGSPDRKLDKQEIVDYWKGIIEQGPGVLIKTFDDMFGKSDWKNIHKVLTSSSKIPDSLKKWVNKLTKTKNIKFQTINALLSLCYSLINKIPTKYIEKLTQTIEEKYSITPYGILKHAEVIAKYDLRNDQNRLNAVCSEEKMNEIKTIYKKNSSFFKKPADEYSKGLTKKEEELIKFGAKFETSNKYL